jgi:hypothetical protein
LNASSPRPARGGAKKTGTKLSTSLIVGLLLVPLSAVAAVALVNPESSSATQDASATTTTVAVETTTTMAETTTTTAEITGADDLALACGEQGQELVDKEADDSITPLEQAALDSLRAICSEEGMELSGPPAPEPVVQTETVVAGPPPATTTTEVGTSDDDHGDDQYVDSAAAEFEKEYAATVAYINKAIDEGARGTEIDEAKQLLAEAGALADSGDYAAGMEKLAEARQKADAAPRRSYDDDDEGEHHGGDDGDHGEYDD